MLFRSSSPPEAKKPSVFRGSATIFQSNTYPYMTTGKIIALTIQTFVGKVMSLPFNMLSSNCGGWIKIKRQTNVFFKNLVSENFVSSAWKKHYLLFSWVSKSLLTVTAAMKLKDTCSLEGKLCQT